MSRFDEAQFLAASVRSTTDDCGGESDLAYASRSHKSPEQKACRRELDTPRDQVISLHEAAHAVVSLRLGGDVKRIELCDLDHDDLERRIDARTGSDFNARLGQAICFLAGPVAECVALGHAWPEDLEALEHIDTFLSDHQHSVGITEDLHDAWLALSVACDLDLQDPRQATERAAAWRWLCARCYRFVVDCWTAIVRVAHVLLDQGSVGSEQLREIVKRATEN